MHTQVYRVAISTVCFVFAAVGFVLSILSVFFTLVFPALVANSKARPLGRRQIRSPHVPVNQSRQTPFVPLSVSPTITVTRTTSCIHPTDNGSPGPSNFKRSQAITFIPNVHRRSFPTLSSRTATSVSSERVFMPIASEGAPRSGLKVSTMWGEKRPKIYRCVSSPHLTTLPVAPELDRSEPQPDLLRKKKTELFRRESGDLAKPRSASLDGVIARKKYLEKKKPPVLRTNPYEAPYFVPSPVDSVTVKQGKPIRRAPFFPLPPSTLHPSSIRA